MGELETAAVALIHAIRTLIGVGQRPPPRQVVRNVVQLSIVWPVGQAPAPSIQVKQPVSRFWSVQSPVPVDVPQSAGQLCGVSVRPH